MIVKPLNNNWLYKRSVNYEKSVNSVINYLNNLECNNAIEESTRLLKKIVKFVKTIKNYDQTPDYHRYGLYPGQQIRRKARGYIPHAAIYLFEGLIVEIGSGPKKCELDLPKFSHIHLAGLITLDVFLKNTEKDKVIPYKVNTPKDGDKAEISSRMDRLIEVFGWYKYNIITNNCLSMANYVSYGNRNYFKIIKDYYKVSKIKVKSTNRSKRRKRSSFKKKYL
jgi:hypothetical protein